MLRPRGNQVCVPEFGCFSLLINHGFGIGTEQGVGRDKKKDADLPHEKVLKQLAKRYPMTMRGSSSRPLVRRSTCNL